MKIDVRGFGKYAEVLERDEKVIRTSPTETMKTRSKYMIMYRKKISIAPKEEIKKALEDMWKNMVFHTRGRRFEAVKQDLKTMK